MNPAPPQPQSVLSQLTPEEQKLIADCFTRIRDIPDQQEQLAIIEQMLPPELVQRLMQLMGNQTQQAPAAPSAAPQQPQTFKV